MNITRITKLKQYCHDETIRLKTSQDCGKILPNIETVRTLYQILEEILEHVGKDLGSR